MTRMTLIPGLALLALLLAGPAAATGEPSSDLLASVTEPGTTLDDLVAADLLTAEELDAIQGEGTFSKFISLPQLRRSFERMIEFGDLKVTIVATEGVGIDLLIEHPSIP